MPKLTSAPKYLPREKPKTGAKTTKLTTQTMITKIKGSCPKCGGPLHIKPQVCAWNPDGSPSMEDTFLTPYCKACKLFWIGEAEQ